MTDRPGRDMDQILAGEAVVRELEAVSAGGGDGRRIGIADLSLLLFRPLEQSLDPPGAILGGRHRRQPCGNCGEYQAAHQDT